MEGEGRREEVRSWDELPQRAVATRNTGLPTAVGDELSRLEVKEGVSKGILASFSIQILEEILGFFPPGGGGGGGTG